MSPDLILLVVAVLAIGCGVSLGWVLAEKHRRANPEGVAKVAAAATAQIEQARADADKQVERIKATFEETNAALVEQLAVWQSHAHALAGRLSATPATPLPPPPEPPRALTPEQSVARVTGDGVEPETKLRDTLMNHGVPAEKIDAMLAGKLDNVPTSELLDQLTDGIVRESTGLT